MTDFIALTLLVGHWEEHSACKKFGWWGAGVYLSGTKCRWSAYRPADAMPPHHLCKIRNGSAFMVPAYPGCPGKEAVKQECVQTE